MALDGDGRPLPGLAQVAQQQGRHLGRVLAARRERGDPLPPFRFRDRGNAAIVGRNAAVFDFGRWRLTGFPAWLLWALVHVYLLVGFERRLRVAAQWLWSYLTYERAADHHRRDRAAARAPGRRLPGPEGRHPGGRGRHWIGGPVAAWPAGPPPAARVAPTRSGRVG